MEPFDRNYRRAPPMEPRSLRHWYQGGGARRVRHRTPLFHFVRAAKKLLALAAFRLCPLDKRPQLAAALAAAKAAKCSVIVAKLDRLSRDVAFVAGLMAQRVSETILNSRNPLQSGAEELGRCLAVGATRSR